MQPSLRDLGNTRQHVGKPGLWNDVVHLGGHDQGVYGMTGNELPQPLLPRPLVPFVEFAPLLRTNGFPVAPKQTQSFIAAVGLLEKEPLSALHMPLMSHRTPPSSAP